MTGKRGSICTVGMASRASPRMKACLKVGWAMHLGGADETGAELGAGRAHLQIGQDRLAAADAAGDEDRHVRGHAAGSPAPAR